LFVFFHQLASQNRYGFDLFRALMTHFVTTTVPSVVSVRLTIRAQVAQNRNQMFLIQTVVLAFPKFHGLLQFLFSFVCLLQHGNQQTIPITIPLNEFFSLNLISQQIFETGLITIKPESSFFIYLFVYAGLYIWAA